MQWPDWDTFDAGETLVDCRVIAPSDLETFLVKKAEMVRWKQKQIDEMENDVSFELMRTLLTRKCDEEWVQEKKKNRAMYWVIDGAVTKDVMCKYGWVKDNGCRLCGGAGTEKHRLYPCKEWNHLRLELDHEVRLMEQLVKDDIRCLL